MGLSILMVSMFVLYSCSKKAQENLSKDQIDQQDKDAKAIPIDAKNFTESDSDLTTVDYKQFYDQLAPHGEWIQVKAEDIGLKSKIVSSESSGNNNFSVSNLFGVKDAFADADLSVGMAFVWKPSSDLGVALVAGEAPMYRPYSNGRWVNTNDGWYFRGATPVEETTSHYGRWVNSRDNGWLWVPGRVWAPAWVDWRQNDDYISWAALPPSDYLIDGNMSNSYIDDDNYVTVNRNYFLEPDVYKYNDVYYDNGDRILVSEMSILPGLSIVNSIVINRGPDVNIFQVAYGRNIDLVNIQYVNNYNDIRYSDRNYYVYRPIFERYKHHDNGRWSMSEPKSFKKYDEWKGSKENNGNDNGNKNKGYDNGSKNQGYDNSNKNKSDNGNKNKYNDNGNKNKGNDNGNKNKGNDNGNKNKGNDNGNKNKGNDNGNKNKGNDNGNKGNDNGNRNKGNDNGNKNKGNDNGNKNKGNDNGNKNKGNDNGNKGNDNGNKGKNK
jgi:hypothetical protein